MSLVDLLITGVLSIVVLAVLALLVWVSMDRRNDRDEHLDRWYGDR